MSDELPAWLVGRLDSLTSDEAKRAISALTRHVESKEGPTARDEAGAVDPSALSDRIRKAMPF